MFFRSCLANAPNAAWIGIGRTPRASATERRTRFFPGLPRPIAACASRRSFSPVSSLHPAPPEAGPSALATLVGQRSGWLCAGPFIDRATSVRVGQKVERGPVIHPPSVCVTAAHFPSLPPHGGRSSRRGGGGQGGPVGRRGSAQRSSTLTPAAPAYNRAKRWERGCQPALDVISQLPAALLGPALAGGLHVPE